MSDERTTDPQPSEPVQLPGIVTPWTPEKAFPEPAKMPATPTPLPPALKQSYADSMAAGETLGPQDFHDAYHAAGHEPIPDLAAQLPDQQTLIDTAIDGLTQSSIPATPEMVNTVKQNLMDHWAATGQPPASAIQDPDLRDRMARAPGPPQDIARLGGIVQQLETGTLANPDAAVSSTGALGRNQIEPSTARQYGFDPAKLGDAAYNNQVRDVILSDLSNKFHGETAAILIGYNAGPAVAQKWIASGRDNSVLPDETQKYLRTAARLDGGMTMAPVSRETYEPTPGITFTQKVQQAAADFADEFEKYASEQGEKEADALRSGDLGQYLKREAPEETEKAAELAINFTPLGAGTLAGETLRTMFPSLSTTAELARTAESMAGREFAQNTIRAATGQARRYVAAGNAALESFRASINKALPEYQAWLDQHPGIAIPMWGANTPAIAHLIDHVEGGGGGGKLAPNSPMAPVADALRELYQTARSEIETHVSDTMGFVDDYYRHLWKDPAAASRAFSGASRTGSSASLNLRSIPTIMQGIAKGLTPRILDPIENTLHYISGMHNFIAWRRVFDAGRNAGFIKYARPGEEPTGWDTLKGRSNTIADPAGTGGVMRAYAPPGYASSYNSYVGRGFLDWSGPAASIYGNLQRASNLMTAGKLAISGYHYLVIAGESVTAGIANAIGELAHGELVRGVKDLGLSVTIAPKLSASWRRGSVVTKAYLAQGGSPLDQQLASLIAEAGGRVVGRGEEYGFTQAENWGRAFMRGSLAQELKTGLVNTLGDLSEPAARRAALALPRVGAFFGHELGRIMGSLTAPLFDKIIPRLKTAAVADELATFLRQNPTATHEATLAYARRIVDSMDDRFGEMVQDNLFWPRTVKQAINLVTVSVGWEYGTLRAAGGAAKDIMHGDVLGPRARWLLSFLITMGLFSSVYQYLKTGTAALGGTTPGRNAVTPRTGGLTPEGAPERAQLPGQQKDFEQWFRLMQDAPNVFELPSAAAGLAAGKLNPFARIVKGTLTGSDWQGNPIYSAPPDPNTLLPPPGWKTYADFVLNELAPIQLGQQRLRGTNISPGEQAMGIRPAPEWIQNPERVENAEQREQRWQQRQQQRRAARQRARLEE